MGKRKRKMSNDEILRKIRRLERRVTRREGSESDRSDRRHEEKEQRHERSSSRSGFDDDDNYHEEIYYDEEDEFASNASVKSVVRPVSPPALPTSTPLEQNQEKPVTPQPQQLEISQEIALLLGQAKRSEQPLGEKVPDEISKRWGKILVDGLDKENKETLCQQMLIPENFTLARAPILNAEVSAVLTESAKNRDKRMEKAQNQLGLGLAGLVNITKDLIKRDMDKLEIIKQISSVSQILLDLHYEETINRRKLILPLLDKKFLNTIQGIKRDSLLFGDKLGDNIKNTKDIEKSSQHIKKPNPYQPQQRKNSTTPAGNARVPPRHQIASKTAPRYQYGPASTSRRPAKTRTRAPPPGRSRDHYQK